VDMPVTRSPIGRGRRWGIEKSWLKQSSSPFPSLQFQEEKRKATSIPRSAAGQGGVSSPLLPPPRRRERVGTPFLCSRHVDSRVGSPGGAVVLGVAASRWNKGSGGSPSSRRSFVRSRRAAGGVCSRIVRSGEIWCSGRGRRGEDGGLRLELFVPCLFFVASWCALASVWRVWGWCGAAPARCVGCCCRLYRSLCDCVVSPLRAFLRAAGLAFAGDSGSTSCSSRGVSPADAVSSTPRSRCVQRAAHAATSTELGLLSACAGDSAASRFLFVSPLVRRRCDGEDWMRADLVVQELPGCVRVIFLFLRVFSASWGQQSRVWMFPVYHRCFLN
jgi:hypothetical protein